MKSTNTFFKFVIPSVLSFALSGVYAIVDGYFVGNTIGDAGLSAINIAYPIVAVIQSVGTGIGMGGAVHYSINKAVGSEKRARNFIAGVWWLLIIFSIISTICGFLFAKELLMLLGARDSLLTLGVEYIKYISLGAGLQVLSTGLVPLMRNYGGAVCAMVAMVSGFVTNVIFDYILVWNLNGGIKGAAIATIFGEGITAVIAIVYLLYKKSFTLKISLNKIKNVWKSIFKVGLAPFGLSLTPNISLVLINWFSAQYGGESAIATYACISYIICIVYLILQGVGDGSQPLMSKYYGERDFNELHKVNKLAYSFAMVLSLVGVVLLFLTKGQIGGLFGSSEEVNQNISNILPVFLISVPFVAISRIATASFYATKQTVLSYVLTFVEPLLMFLLMLILPPLFGGQVMIWWSTVFARIITAVIAIALNLLFSKQKNLRQKSKKNC